MGWYILLTYDSQRPLGDAARGPPCAEAALVLQSLPAKYKTRFGMLVELIYKGSAHYTRAPIPPQHLQDAKFMAVQERFKAALASMTTAQQLYDAVPRAHPWIGAPS